MSTLSIPRESRVPLGEFFNSNEFDCHCGCETTLIDETLISNLNALRSLVGVPLVILSGYRCEKKQAALKAKGFKTADGLSTHELGMAADIMTKKLSGPELEPKARKAGFLAVGVAPSWIHVDVRPGKKRHWEY